MKNKLRNITGLIMLGLVMAQNTLAQTGLQPPGQIGNLPDLSSGRGVTGLVEWIINMILIFAGLIAVLFIIIGGFQYILSGANEDLAKRGKTTVVNAVIGLIIIILSYTVIRVVFRTLTNT